MLKTLRKVKQEIYDTSVYLEIYGDNKTAYRVISGKTDTLGTPSQVYGIEVQDCTTGETESIPDFSKSVEDAVSFTGLLVKNRCRPKNIYSLALGYLKSFI